MPAVIAARSPAAPPPSLSYSCEPFFLRGASGAVFNPCDLPTAWDVDFRCPMPSRDESLGLKALPNSDRDGLGL